MYCGAPYSGSYRFCMGCGRSLEIQYEEQAKVQENETEPISNTQSRPHMIKTSSAPQSTRGKAGASSSLDNLDLEAIFASHPYDDDEPEDATTVYANESAINELAAPVPATSPQAAEDVPEEAVPLSLDILLGMSETVDSDTPNPVINVQEAAGTLPSGSIYEGVKTSNHEVQDVAAKDQTHPQPIGSQQAAQRDQVGSVAQYDSQQRILQPTPQPLQQPAPQPTPQSTPQSDSHPTHKPAATVPLDEDMDAPTLVFRREPVPILRRLRSGEEYSLVLPAIIGRGSAATLRIAGNRFISRVHALIEKTADGYAIADRASANRTMVNGRNLQGTALYSLRDGDHIQLADEEFVFSIIKPDAIPASRQQEGTGESR